MELEEAKKILMGLPEYQDLVSKEFEAIDTVIHELVALQELLDEKKEEIEEYQKQLDLDYVDENYIRKDKIKEKIEELEQKIQEIYKRIEKTKTKMGERVLWNKSVKLQAQVIVLEELLKGE